MSSITKIIKRINPLLLVLGLGLFLRLIGLNWDQNSHLHPDERFLTMVMMSLKIPENFINYFQTDVSLLNPHNTGFGFFVYGRFPLILTKVLAGVLNLDNYNDLTLLGRFLSAILDASVIIAIYKTVKLFVDKKNLSLKRFPLYSALFYAVFVFPIQQAHFFTADSFVNSFFIWSFYFSLKFYFSEKKSNSVLNLLISAFFLGLAIASKISIFYVLPIIIFPIFLSETKKLSIKNFFTKVFDLIKFFLLTYFFLRFFDPYLFYSSNFFNPYLNPKVITNLQTLVALSKPGAYPPGLQWINKGFFFGLQNIIFFGIGLVFFILFLFGIFKAVLYWMQKLKSLNLRKMAKQPIFILIISIAISLLIFFVYQSLQFTKTMRYYLFLYPFIAIVCGFGLASLKDRSIKVSIFFIGFSWTLLFIHIYLVPHSRVIASFWMQTKLPDKSTIAYEHWDDALPIYSTNTGKKYSFLALDLYQNDSTSKWQLIAKKLKYTDYISLSSNRLWGTIPSLPKLYPETSRYYQKLFSGELGFKKIAEFTSYPLIQIGSIKFEIPDQWSEEAFTVYDHPKVMIYQKTKSFSEKRFYDKIVK